jgi:ABC-type branched-subunit amino acid transport system ATPase component
MTALLAAEGLVAGYGDVTIIRDVDLEVRSGEVVALLGPNGAGKTTAILTLAGEIRPRSGRVSCRGVDDTNKATHLRSREGMAIVTDERAVFMRMSVAENIRVFRSSVDAVIELFPELRDHLERPVALLSGGQQQMLALGLALSRQPSVILADELSLGLAPMLVDRLFEVLRQAADNGAGVLLVEQYVHKAMSIADRVYVMDRGRISIAGTSEELGHRVDEIQSSYLSGVDAESASS